MLSVRPTAHNADRRTAIAKTPGRNVKGRNVLLENSVFHGPLTGNANGRKQTPLRPKTLQPQRLFKDAGTSQPLSKRTTTATQASSRPLLDKTPFQNRRRVSPAFNTPDTVSKSLKPHSASLLLPSSTRKHIRVPRSASKSFETPPNKGNHWDVSDFEIAVPDTQSVVEEGGVREDYDEIEYMPPRPVDLPYSPPFNFELPDYKQLGKTLLEQTHPYPLDYTTPQLDYLSEVPPKAECQMPLPELDNDDPFEAVSKTSTSAAKSTKRATPASTSMKRPITLPHRTQAVLNRIPSSVPSNARTTPAIMIRGTSKPVTKTTQRAGKNAEVSAPKAKPSGMSEAGTTGTRILKPATSVVRRAGTSLSVYGANMGARKPVLSSTSGRGGLATHPARDEGLVLSFEDTGLGGEDFLFDV